MEIVNLDRVPCLGSINNLKILNRLFQTREAIMLHELSVSVGCRKEEAMQFFMLLYDLNLVEPLLVVYHNDHLDIPIQTRDFLDGFPTIPFTCAECEHEITSKDQLSYDFLFKLKDLQISFVLENDAL